MIDIDKETTEKLFDEYLKNKTATEIIEEHNAKMEEIVENSPKYNEGIYWVAYEMAIDYIVDHCPTALVNIEPDKNMQREVLQQRFIEQAKYEIMGRITC